MKNNQSINKAVVAVSAALVFVLILVVAVFVFGQSGGSNIEISIPEVQTDAPVPENDLYLSDNMLLQITPDNAAIALRSLKKPEYYHQQYRITTSGSYSQAVSELDLWVNGNFTCAKITSDRLSKTILTNGNAVYLWYETAPDPIYLELSDDITFEDVLGLPAFDYLQTLQKSKVTDAEYLLVDKEHRETSCIFLSIQETPGAVTRYWIDLSSGLLFEADQVEDSNQIYTVEQLAFDRLVESDETFADKLLLPDGSQAFTERT